MGRRVIALIAAAVLAIVGAGLVLLYVQKADERSLAGQQPKTVYITEKVIPAGTSLKDAQAQGLITRTEAAARATPAGAVATIDEVNDSQVALTDVGPGQVVLQAAFGSTPLGQNVIRVAPGKVAVSVSLADPNRVGAFVSKGSLITIFDTFTEKRVGIDKATEQFNSLNLSGTAVLLSNVTVLAVGPALGAPVVNESTSLASSQTANQSTPTSTSILVTVEVSPADSLRLVHAIQHTANQQNDPAKHLYLALQGATVPAVPSAVDDLTYHGAAK